MRIRIAVGEADLVVGQVLERRGVLANKKFWGGTASRATDDVRLASTLRAGFAEVSGPLGGVHTNSRYLAVDPPPKSTAGAGKAPGQKATP